LKDDKSETDIWNKILFSCDVPDDVVKSFGIWMVKATLSVDQVLKSFDDNASGLAGSRPTVPGTASYPRLSGDQE